MDTTTQAQVRLDQGEGAGSQSLWAVAWRRLRRRKLVMISLAVIIVYVVIAFAVGFGLLASDWDKTVSKHYQAPTLKRVYVEDSDGGQAGGTRRELPRWKTILGTDIEGRSVLAKTLCGAKTSLTVATVASVISICIGVPLGAIAGYFGRWVDAFIVWLYSTLESIPYILLILAFAFVLQDKVLFEGTRFELRLVGITAVYLAIGLTSWVGLCRLIRGEVIKHKERDYVAAAKAFGASDFYVIFRHIVPNVFHLVIIDFSLRFVRFIHAEVILSFLGLGAKNQPSWGVMIDDARLEVVRSPIVWWQMAAATVAIFLISLALNVFGDALRDALDPKLKGR